MGFFRFPALLHAQPVPNIPAARLRRVCSARCPESWPGGFTQHGTAAPEANCFAQLRAAESRRDGPLGDGPAGESFWFAPRSLLPRTKQKVPTLFSVKKMRVAIQNGEKTEGPDHIGPAPLFLCKIEKIRVQQSGQQSRASKQRLRQAPMMPALS